MNENINNQVNEFKIDLLEFNNTKLNKLTDFMAWCIHIRKLRYSFRNKILNDRSDQIRSDQIRSDQIRIILHKEYAYLNNTLINNKFQPMLQNKIAA